MKRIILFLTFITILFTAMFTTQVTYAANISTENETISFEVTKDSSYAINNDRYFNTTNPKVGSFLEAYYDHQFKLGVEQINVKLKINDNDLIYPGFYSVTEEGINLFYQYFEFNTMQDAQIIFKYDTSALEIIGGPYGFNFEGIWEMDIPKIIYHDIEELPITIGSEVGIVTFIHSNKNLTVDILLGGQTYQFKRVFAATTDMSLFDTVEAYYINPTGEDPQIIISHADQTYLLDMINSPEDARPVFVPHSIWDLKTNEISSQNKYATNIHVKQNDKGVIIAYVYIDEFIMDKVISAHFQWTSRQKNSFPASIISGKYTDWETKEDILVSDKYLTYKNLTSDWQNYMPVWNVVRGIYQVNKTYRMPRIQSVDLNNPQKDYNITKFEIEDYFRQTNDDFDYFNSDPRYKLWAFALQGGKSFMGVQTEMYPEKGNPDDPLRLKIMEMIYETNGRLYTTKGDDMKIHISVGGKLNPDNNKNIKDYLSMIIFIASVGFVGLVMYKNKAFRSPKAFIITLVLIGLFGVLIYFAYQYFVIGELVLSVVRLL